MADKSNNDVVKIAVSASRERESGHVFCAAILEYQGQSARLNGILPCRGAGSENYVSMSAGLAFITRQALLRLNRKCHVKVFSGTNMDDFNRNLEISAGYRKAPKGDMKAITNTFDALVHAINLNVEKGDIKFAWEPEDSLVNEATATSESFRDIFIEKTAALSRSPNKVSPAPSL